MENKIHIEVEIKVHNYEQFIRRNFDLREGVIILKWIEDTDVSFDMGKRFKQHIIKMLKKGDY